MDRRNESARALCRNRLVPLRGTAQCAKKAADCRANLASVAATQRLAADLGARRSPGRCTIGR
jgi:hypothetical protein